ncbi:hypothetical protein PAHAL_5G387200 [Panicum hallii]|uniref:Uncharacterized protein n=1 Tax=Panicum hallii TaxID=206008 RepID=A0A2T8IMJ8_9POAL|nr:hypothetical protein PAHAL_5G387200 [Panicum hallii]
MAAEDDEQEPNRTVLRTDWITSALLIKQTRNELNRRKRDLHSIASHIKAKKEKRRREGRAGGWGLP